MDTCHDYDVAVAGGGVAGAAAAVAAARLGAKTVLVEKTCTPGGLASAGLINIYPASLRRQWNAGDFRALPKN